MGFWRDRDKSLATELSRMMKVWWEEGVISRARHTVIFSPVLLEGWELPMVGGGAR